MIFNMVSGGGGSQPTPPGSYPSLFVTGLTEQDTCTATCNGKTFNGVWTSKGRLPSEYQEVEYIESSGTQYIDTNLQNGDNIGYKLRLSLKEYSSEKCIVGGQGSSGALALFTYSSKFYPYWNTGKTTSLTVANDTIYDIDFNYKADRKFTVNESNLLTLDTTSGATTTSNHKVYLFSGYAWTQYGASIKMYSCEITNGSNVVRNFIPCYRKSDNVIGMYDTVNDVFYTNAGSGSFTKGADIDQSGFLFSNLTELGTYIVSNGTSTMAILIDAPIEYTLEWSTIPRNGLIAEYLFDGDTLDSSPNGNDLANHGVTFANNTGVFSGSAYAQANAKVIPENSAYSISCWFKKSGTGYDYLFDTINGNSNNKGISIQFKQSGQIQARIDDSNTSTEYQVSSQNNVNDGIWHHLVFAWTGTTENNGMKLYIDGVLNAQATSGFNASTHTYNLTIGKPNNLTQYYLNGSLDNIRIYNRVLTDVEIEALYDELPHALIPTMTSNTTPSGEASGNLVNGINLPYRAFDRDTTTKYTGGTNQTLTGAWIKYKFAESHIVTSMRLKVYRTWSGKLQGSNDDTVWEYIHSFTVTNLDDTYYFNNKKEYKYYKILVTDGGSNTGNYMDMSICQLYGY